jgi:transcriptional regulator of acetoin/glycerol metabolism
MIIDCLKANRWQQRQTALIMGMPKSTFYDKLKKLNIDVASLRKEPT